MRAHAIPQRRARRLARSRGSRTSRLRRAASARSSHRQSRRRRATRSPTSAASRRDRRHRRRPSRPIPARRGTQAKRTRSRRRSCCSGDHPAGSAAVTSTNAVFMELFPYYETPPNNRPKNRVLRSGCRSHRRTAHVGRTQRDLCFPPARLWRREKYVLVPESSKKAAHARAPGAARRTKRVIRSQIRVRAHPGFWAIRSAKRGRPNHPRRPAAHRILLVFSYLCLSAGGG